MATNSRNSIYINGRFLTQNRTGVQRYCRQVVLAIDQALQEKDCPASLRDLDWQLVAPRGTICDLSLERIRFQEIGKGAGHLWEQGPLLWHTRHGKLLSMGNSGPIFHRRQIVVIHDAAIYFAPGGFAWKYRALHSWLGRCLARTAQIATVSEFSRLELMRALHVPSANMLLAPNGVDHFKQLPHDGSILERLGLTEGKYFVTLGLSTANKNIALAIEAHRLLNRADTKLVIAGEGAARVAGSQRLAAEDGVLITGRLSDVDLAGLMRSATAFVFPSRYEGFGIPPLEAMVQGCPVLASTAPAVLEVCGGAALHFHPDDAEGLASLMRKVIDGPGIAQDLRSKGYRRPEQYRWSTASAALMQGVANLPARA
jgi:glycosyltransferase involved in cell wall biosynthesis